ncbi:hypothetical protein [Azoarcus sp. KH32C]|uniref:hypothetical protein n=1 Tax=Azoarcus sp. KH32C TaxID=748247 RepID=UPI0012EA7688|nr:hypothetical protein [Azoarcus sp. KH32C]
MSHSDVTMGSINHNAENVMLRNEWKFAYTAAKLAEAAHTKLDHHDQRIAFWKAKKDEVMALIRSEGLEIDEKIVLQYSSPKARDWERGAQVMVRNDLSTDLDECVKKLAWHTDKRKDYDGWLQALSAAPEERHELDIDDWLFFFGRV